MTLTIFILLFYVLPMLITMFDGYIDEETKTIRDFLKWSWVYFLPLVNLFFSFGLLIMYIGELKTVKRIRTKWNQLLDTPIKNK